MEEVEKLLRELEIEAAWWPEGWPSRVFYCGRCRSFSSHNIIVGELDRVEFLNALQVGVEPILVCIHILKGCWRCSSTPAPYCRAVVFHGLSAFNRAESLALDYLAPRARMATVGAIATSTYPLGPIGLVLRVGVAEAFMGDVWSMSSSIRGRCATRDDDLEVHVADLMGVDLYPRHDEIITSQGSTTLGVWVTKGFEREGKALAKALGKRLWVVDSWDRPWDLHPNFRREWYSLAEEGGE